MKKEDKICSGNHGHPKHMHGISPDIETIFDLSEFFKIFGDSTRLSIISVLYSNKELCVCDIAKEINMSQSAISHQLRILRSGGLIRPRRDGKTVYYSLDDEHVNYIYEMGLTHILHKRGELSLD